MLPNSSYEASIALVSKPDRQGKITAKWSLSWAQTQKVKVAQSYPTLCNPTNYTVHVGSLSLLQRIFPTHGSNPGLKHCGWTLHQLSHKGSPRILEWVAYPFSRGSSRPRNRTGVSCVAGRFFTYWAIRETPQMQKHSIKQTQQYIKKSCTMTSWDVSQVCKASLVSGNQLLQPVTSTGSRRKMIWSCK